ncbi:MAG: uroporphyrinogen decarboxylase family protein [bacterium]|nr:uroporphyrinogen decarboxylase family protein [bacterium]
MLRQKTMGISAKENLIRAIMHDHPDHVPYYNEGGILYVDYDGAMPPKDGADIWGVYWQSTKSHELPFVVKHPVSSFEELENYLFPNPKQPGRFDIAASTIKKHKKNNLIVGRHLFPLFTRSWTLLGMENILIALSTNPQAVKQLYRLLTNYELEIAQQYVEIGVEAGRFSDDYGGQTQLLMSPAVWRELIKPYLQEISSFYRNHGLFMFLHSCGNIMEIMHDLVEMGIQVFNIQTRANNLVKLKQLYGDRITFHGGIDTQHTLLLGTPQEIKEEVKQCILALGKNGGLILEPDQNMPIPTENLNALIEAAKEFGKYPINY